MEAIYPPTTDALELRRKRPDEARAWQGAPPLSLRLELRGDEVILVLTPLREGWLPFLQGVAMAPEKPAWRNTPSSLISAMRDHEDRQILEVAFNQGVYLYFTSASPARYMRACCRWNPKGIPSASMGSIAIPGSKRAGCARALIGRPYNPARPDVALPLRVGLRTSKARDVQLGSSGGAGSLPERLAVCGIR